MTRARDPGRPRLTRSLSLQQFRDHYWYLDELVKFCRAEGLATSGMKGDLVARIEVLLEGKPQHEPTRAHRAAAAKKMKRTGPLRLETPVGDDFKCDAETREFFKSVIGDRFHFTAQLQAFRRSLIAAGETLTYGDLADEWLAEVERRRDPSYKSTLNKSWEYITFVRAFWEDRARNAGKAMPDVARAWNQVRVNHGPRTYAEYLRLLGEDA